MSESEYRIYRRVLQLVQELHLRGYQQIRIAPGLSATGMHWRCAITTASKTLRNHGAQMLDRSDSSTVYSTADGRTFFGWPDAGSLIASQLANRFAITFPTLVAEGQGSD